MTGLENLIVTPFPHGLALGQRLVVGGDTNRVRRRVVSVDSETRLIVVTHHRPSKGFARHLRRMKADAIRAMKAEGNNA
jgi:hypothetical protein